MTDVPPPGPSVPSRLGVAAAIEDGRVLFSLEPRAEHLVHGVVRASVHAYLVDAVAAATFDSGVDWKLTTDMSVRAVPRPAPARIEARSRTLRAGKRSATATVDLLTADGDVIAAGAAGFVTLERRPGDPPKADATPAGTVARFRRWSASFLSAPLRDEAGICSIDPAAGVVEVPVTDELRNSNGTMQGAMVMLIAEAAAEDLVQARFGVRAVVTDLDVRFLNRVDSGFVRSSCRTIGDGPTAMVEVILQDVARDRPTALVYARAAVVD